jgi:glycosyltransferase involved in cell wall biosynthesis
MNAVEASARGDQVANSVLIPAFNEADAIARTLDVLGESLSRIPGYRWEIVVVNDGSRDGTLDVVKGYRSRHATVVAVDLSRNFGKEAALSAGLSVCTGRAVIPFDADLQDPPDLIPAMLEAWRHGADVVLAKRVDRSSDGLLKRKTAEWFYGFMNRFSDVVIPENVGDFRLMDRVVVDTILRLPENRRFMKGLFAWAGFRSAVVEYARPPRRVGESKFNGVRLLNLAIEGITSFSVAPLRAASYLGMLVAAIGCVYALWVVGQTLVHGVDVKGYASLMVVLLVTSGVQLISLGIIGEYVGRTYLEAKRRPAYVIREVSVAPPA